ncbi:arsenate reductase (glutaredoxin) [Malaciobacter molluscorum LMG 25693]|uniref:Arsenate reductase (ArsC) family protein n=1 Tax=Malaciobacter molluscorum LMG 25693 TaxID=870501 RepID=A0A2G1DKQ1_9BACT|nr:arsenate reductase (glutaredoxin) [Malaciobacter molluscorum]AXX92625.1 arsenate reductase (ArsC) family protein [Malaciobacter molluscorum LMG 25693]PHO19049.1 arsenate reductase (glutaredoxin) [Malaciobacter molluscorum LMG 25693]RXJ97355.1 arsenate reductase (glutaredoxin) [Malaciobacter molluscorum]
MQDVTIWHNPKCGKSRDALKFLEEKGLDIKVVKYLETVPNEEEIKKVLQMLGIAAKDLIRKKEDIYKELNLKDVENEDELIKAMVQNPKLIERPIIIKDGDAIIARPKENIQKLFM